MFRPMGVSARDQLFPGTRGSSEKGLLNFTISYSFNQSKKKKKKDGPEENIESRGVSPELLLLLLNEKSCNQFHIRWIITYTAI